MKTEAVPPSPKAVVLQYTALLTALRDGGTMMVNYERITMQCLTLQCEVLGYNIQLYHLTSERRRSSGNFL